MENTINQFKYYVNNNKILKSCWQEDFPFIISRAILTPIRGCNSFNLQSTQNKFAWSNLFYLKFLEPHLSYSLKKNRTLQKQTKIINKKTHKIIKQTIADNKFKKKKN